MNPEHREFGFIPLMPTGGWAHKAARFAGSTCPYFWASMRARVDELVSYRVHHEPCRFSHERLDGWDVGPASWNGIVMPDDDAAHACVAEPVDVEVFALQRLG